MFEEIFKYKKVITAELLRYGFQKSEDDYLFDTRILNDEFTLSVIIDVQGNVDTTLTELETNEEYVLYKTEAQGAFIGDVRATIAVVLQDIADKCYRPSVYKQEQTISLIDYVREVYGDELEFLWKSSPTNAIWRRKDTGKWYGAVLTVEKSKLGLDSNEVVEIIDLRARPQQMEELLKQEGFFPGWHMNKKSWFTVILDGSVEDEVLHQLLKESYELAVK